MACACRAESEPDVFLVIVDTLRADAVGYAGAPYDSSPHLDALVEDEAAWYSRAYSASSWTLASTATLLTGRPPGGHGVVRAAKNPTCYGRLAEHVPTVQSMWKSRGYRTGAWINNAFLAPEFGLDASFDVYDFDGAELIGHRTAAQTVDEALAWLDESDEPAFLLVHVMEPHADYDPGPPFAGRFTTGMPSTISVPLGGNLHTGWMTGMLPAPNAQDQAFVKAAYHEEVLAVDAAVNTLIEGMKKRDRWDDAMFVLTSDHGEEFWEHGRYEHGHTLRSEVTRVPLIVKAPAVEAGHRPGLIDAVSVSRALAAADPELLKTTDAIWSENILYGPPSTSLVTETHRLEVHNKGKALVLWELDEGAWEPAEWQPDNDATRSQAIAMRDELLQMRGSLGPAKPVNPTAIASADVFQMLRELGYLDGTNTAASCE